LEKINWIPKTKLLTFSFAHESSKFHSSSSSNTSFARCTTTRDTKQDWLVCVHKNWLFFWAK
jgi:hypothetical protein